MSCLFVKEIYSGIMIKAVYVKNSPSNECYNLNKVDQSISKCM